MRHLYFERAVSTDFFSTGGKWTLADLIAKNGFQSPRALML